MDSTLFDSDFLRKLEQLRLVAQRVRKGLARGEHLTRKRGLSLEFSDYKTYQPGDDYRNIDWNVYSRLEKLVLKIFTAEEDLSLHVLIDASGSMAWGNLPKFTYARRVGAALGYIGMVNHDRLWVSPFAVEPGRPYAPKRGRQHLASFFRFFEGMSCGGATDLNGALRSYAASNRRPGVAFVISDLLDARGYAEGLSALRYARYDVVVLHVLDEAEFAPPLDGPVRLMDVETGRTKTLTVDSQLRQRYRRSLQEYLDALERFCMQAEVEYFRTTTRVPFEDLIMKYLRRGRYLE